LDKTRKQHQMTSQLWLPYRITNRNFEAPTAKMPVGFAISRQMALSAA
jgi:hypothetical protein